MGPISKRITLHLAWMACYEQTRGNWAHLYVTEKWKCCEYDSIVGTDYKVLHLDSLTFKNETSTERLAWDNPSSLLVFWPCLFIHRLIEKK